MAKKNLIRNLLRVLTPDEVIELTNLNSADGMKSLTDLLLKRFDKNFQKNMPFPEIKKVEASEIEPQGLVDSVDSNISSIKNEQKKGVVFILEIKEKMKGCQRALKEQEIIHLYEETSKVDIEQEKGHKDDMKKSGALGVLINKRQF